MARTKQVARISTGGQAPRKQLARQAARKSPRILASKKNVKVVEVRYRPDRGDFRFEAVLEGGDRDSTQQVSLTNWKDSVLGFLVAYSGPKTGSCDGWVPVYDLYGMTNCDLLKSSRSAPALDQSEVVAEKFLIWSRAGEQVHYISACDRNGENPYAIDLLDSTYKDGLVMRKFKDALSVVPAKAYYTGFLHQAAVEQYSEYKYMVRQLEGTPQYKNGTDARYFHASALGSRLPSRGSPDASILTSCVFGVDFTRTRHGVNCIVGACANAISYYDYNHAVAFVQAAKRSPVPGGFKKLRELNPILSAVRVSGAVSGWVDYVIAKTPLPSELMRAPADVRKRMEWVLSYHDRVPLLVTLVTASSSELHVVAIMRRGGHMLVVDTEERYSLKLCKAALSFCCGAGEEIKGIGSVMRVGPAYEMEGPKNAAVVPSSSTAATGSGSRTSDRGSSSKKSPDKSPSRGGPVKAKSPKVHERSSPSPSKHQEDIDKLLSPKVARGSPVVGKPPKSAGRSSSSPNKHQEAVDRLLSPDTRRKSASPERKKQKGSPGTESSRSVRPTGSGSKSKSLPKPRNWGFDKASSSKKK